MRPLARLVGEERFDVLVTDLVMPEMTGIGLIHALLEQGRLPPTLVLSGSQGHRSQAMLRSHLDSHPGRQARLPILYLRKAMDGFLSQLLDRLLALRRLKSVDTDAVREILPVLQEIVRQELAPSVGINLERKNLFFKVLDAFCDARFVFLLRLKERLGVINAWPQIFSDYGSPPDLKKCFEDFSHPTREQLLRFDFREWHDYKGHFTSYTALFSSVRWLLSKSAMPIPAPVGEALKALEDGARQLYRLCNQINALQRSDQLTTFEDVLGQIRETIQFQGYKVHIETAGDKVSLSLPERLFSIGLPILVANAIEAGASEEDILVSAKIVGEGSERSLYVSVTNPGVMPEAIRQRLLARQSLTTKQQGSGLGLTIIREFVESVGGQLVIETDATHTEVGFFIPIEKNQPTPLAVALTV